MCGLLMRNLRVDVDRAGEVSGLHGHSLRAGASKRCLLCQFTSVLIAHEIHDMSLCGSAAAFTVFLRRRPSRGSGGGFLRVVARLRAGVGLKRQQSKSRGPSGLGDGLQGL